MLGYNVNAHHFGIKIDKKIKYSIYNKICMFIRLYEIT